MICVSYFVKEASVFLQNFNSHILSS